MIRQREQLLQTGRTRYGSVQALQPLLTLLERREMTPDAENIHIHACSRCQKTTRIASDSEKATETREAQRKPRKTIILYNKLS